MVEHCIEKEKRDIMAIIDTTYYASAVNPDIMAIKRVFDRQIESLTNDVYDLDSLLFDLYVHDTCIHKPEKNERSRDLGSVGVMKRQKGRAQLAQATRYMEKAPKIVNVKVRQRKIQQPR
ncbi:hypothetical protein P3X46_025809 [Hevea brasiliensis]|uniref:NOG1 N-terminal helical domain-containing protein n=1 Tax=Hevea brasiliensis TaxID=3981 RepID=A0ABQ9L6P8_HEVBR|nr:protein EARLY RESPONSIVE TO DEHYDRATION 15 [Hevea brasiliensis]KAJ9160405.1 hypothetical protein P3X46_025809 [Hevea brasiliensis]